MADREERRLSVEPYDQKAGYCGPASLHMVLDYYGDQESQDRLADLAGTTEEEGTTGEQIVSAAKKLGYEAWLQDESDLEDLKDLVDKGVPVIVDWFSKDTGHYSVVTKIDRDEGTITIQDPEIARSRTMDFEEFVGVWFDFDGDVPDEDDFIVRRMIVVEPKGRKSEGVVLLRQLVREAWRKERVDRESPIFQLTQMMEQYLDNMTDHICDQAVKVLKDRFVGTRLGTLMRHFGEYRVPVDSPDASLMGVTLEVTAAPIMTSAADTGGRHTQVNLNWKEGTFSKLELEVVFQSGTHVTEELIDDYVVPELSTTIRHELQHHQQLFVPYMTGERHSSEEYAVPNLRDSDSLGRYFRHPKEVDAYVTSLFRRALQKSKSDDEVEFEAEMEDVLNTYRRFLRTNDVPGDVVHHEVDRVRRKWLGHLRQKYGTSPK